MRARRRTAQALAALLPLAVLASAGAAQAQRARAARGALAKTAPPSDAKPADGKTTDAKTTDGKTTDAKPADAKPAEAKPAEAKPYDPQLMRLSEILGALTYLGALCGEKDAGSWRQRMQALLDAEGQPAIRRDRLAGAYNAGLQGYELTYRSCTANARAVIARSLAEGLRLAEDVENRYRAS